MKIHSFFVLLFSVYVSCSLINQVRLVDHTSYAIDYVTKTMNIVEERGWSNLKIPDHTFQFNDVIFITPFRGTLVYTDGFVSSIQRVDIIESTVQQVWRFNASAESTHTVTVQATMRLHGVAVGFNVAGHMQGDNEVYHYTAEFVHPMISYAFAVIKDLHTDALSVTVVGTVPMSNNPAEFRPKDRTSDIFHQTFDANDITREGMLAWAEVFQPIAHEVVTQHLEFPRICYNCAV